MTDFAPMRFTSSRKASLEYCESATRFFHLLFVLRVALRRRLGAAFFSFTFAGSTTTANGISAEASAAK
jgi:hypothetical protein